METITCTYCGTQAISGDKSCPGCGARICHGTGWLELFKWAAVAGALGCLLFYETLEHFSIRGYNQYAWHVFAVGFLAAAIAIARLTRGRVRFLHYPRL